MTSGRPQIASILDMYSTCCTGRPQALACGNGGEDRPTGQSRAGQGRAEQGRAGQGRAGREQSSRQPAAHPAQCYAAPTSGTVARLDSKDMCRACPPRHAPPRPATLRPRSHPESESVRVLHLESVCTQSGRPNQIARRYGAPHPRARRAFEPDCRPNNTRPTFKRTNEE